LNPWRGADTPVSTNPIKPTTAVARDCITDHDLRREGPRRS
jgi:hypothetical protein